MNSEHPFSLLPIEIPVLKPKIELDPCSRTFPRRGCSDNYACLVMAKDEDELIEPWLTYHANLFGASNLYVIDNGSISQKYLEVIRRAEIAGTIIIRDHSKQIDFDRKGEIIGEVIQQLDREERYRAYLPLDCDEFVITSIVDEQGKRIFKAEPEAIIRELDQFAAQRKIGKVSVNLSNRLGYLDDFQIAAYSKVLFASGTFAGTDNGYHTAPSRVPDGHCGTLIAYVHYHFRPYQEWKRFSHTKIDRFVDVNDPEALRASGPFSSNHEVPRASS